MKKQKPRSLSTGRTGLRSITARVPPPTKQETADTDKVKKSLELFLSKIEKQQFIPNNVFGEKGNPTLKRNVSRLHPLGPKALPSISNKTAYMGYSSTGRFNELPTKKNAFVEILESRKQRQLYTPSSLGIGMFQEDETIVMPEMIHDRSEFNRNEVYQNDVWRLGRIANPLDTHCPEYFPYRDPLDYLKVRREMAQAMESHRQPVDRICYDYFEERASELKNRQDWITRIRLIKTYNWASRKQVKKEKKQAKLHDRQANSVSTCTQEKPRRVIKLIEARSILRTKLFAPYFFSVVLRETTPLFSQRDTVFMQLHPDFEKENEIDIKNLLEDVKNTVSAPEPPSVPFNVKKELIFVVPKHYKFGNPYPQLIDIQDFIDVFNFYRIDPVKLEEFCRKSPLHFLTIDQLKDLLIFVGMPIEGEEEKKKIQNMIEKDRKRKQNIAQAKEKLIEKREERKIKIIAHKTSNNEPPQNDSGIERFRTEESVSFNIRRSSRQNILNRNAKGRDNPIQKKSLDFIDKYIRTKIMNLLITRTVKKAKKRPKNRTQKESDCNDTPISHNPELTKQNSRVVLSVIRGEQSPKHSSQQAQSPIRRFSKGSEIGSLQGVSPSIPGVAPIQTNNIPSEEQSVASPDTLSPRRLFRRNTFGRLQTGQVVIGNSATPQLSNFPQAFFPEAHPAEQTTQASKLILQDSFGLNKKKRYRGTDKSSKIITPVGSEHNEQESPHYDEFGDIIEAGNTEDPLAEEKQSESEIQEQTQSKDVIHVKQGKKSKFRVEYDDEDFLKLQKKSEEEYQKKKEEKTVKIIKQEEKKEEDLSKLSMEELKKRLNILTDVSKKLDKLESQNLSPKNQPSIIPAKSTAKLEIKPLTSRPPVPSKETNGEAHQVKKFKGRNTIEEEDNIAKSIEKLLLRKVETSKTKENEQKTILKTWAQLTDDDYINFFLGKTQDKELIQQIREGLNNPIMMKKVVRRLVKNDDYRNILLQKTEEERQSQPEVNKLLEDFFPTTLSLNYSRLRNIKAKFTPTLEFSLEGLIDSPRRRCSKFLETNFDSPIVKKAEPRTIQQSEFVEKIIARPISDVFGSSKGGVTQLLEEYNHQLEKAFKEKTSIESQECFYGLHEKVSIIEQILLKRQEQFLSLFKSHENNRYPVQPESLPSIRRGQSEETQRSHRRYRVDFALLDKRAKMTNIEITDRRLLMYIPPKKRQLFVCCKIFNLIIIIKFIIIKYFYKYLFIHSFLVLYFIN